MTKRINKTYRVRKTKELEKKVFRVRCIFLFAAICLVRVAMADTTIQAPQPQIEAVEVSDDVPLYSPEGLEGVEEIKEVAVVAASEVEPVKKVKTVKAEVKKVVYPVPEDEAKAFIYQHESGNNPAAVNKSSGSCGIGQRLPCKLLVADCPNWKTDYACQDAHFTRYMLNRYGSWSKARQHWLQFKWW